MSILEDISERNQTYQYKLTNKVKQNEPTKLKSPSISPYCICREVFIVRQKSVLRVNLCHVLYAYYISLDSLLLKPLALQNIVIIYQILKISILLLRPHVHVQGKKVSHDSLTFHKQRFFKVSLEKSANICTLNNIGSLFYLRLYCVQVQYKW